MRATNWRKMTDPHTGLAVYVRVKNKKGVKIFQYEFIKPIGYKENT